MRSNVSRVICCALGWLSSRLSATFDRNHGCHRCIDKQLNWTRDANTGHGGITHRPSEGQSTPGACRPFITISLSCWCNGPLARLIKFGLRMRREFRECYPRHRGLMIPACITTRAWRTCRDACPDRWLAFSFEVAGGEYVPGIPGACATRNFTYLVRGPYHIGTLH